jgi:hypothetical protein
LSLVHTLIRSCPRALFFVVLRAARRFALALLSRSHSFKETPPHSITLQHRKQKNTNKKTTDTRQSLSNIAACFLGTITIDGGKEKNG